MENEIPDRVITQEETKLFPVKAELMYVDGGVYDFSTASLQVVNPLPVYSDDKRHIGFADVSVKGKRIVADINIDYSSPERLSIETGEKLYARIYGKTKLGINPFFDFQQRIPILKMTIEGVQITRAAPSDERIDALGKLVP